MRAKNVTQETAKPQGYIALNRAIREHWIWDDPVRLKWWLDILMEVNYKEKDVSLGGQIIKCKRGESLNSLKTWAKRWMVDTGKVRRFFKMLESAHMINTVSVVKTTRLTVCNYDNYNKPQQVNDTQTTRPRHADDTQTTLNNKDNKDNKDEKGEQRDAPELPQTYGSSSTDPRIPTQEAVRLAFVQRGGSAEMAEAFYAKHGATEWHIGTTPIRNFTTLIPKFIKAYIEIENRNVDKQLPAPINGKLQPNEFV